MSKVSIDEQVRLLMQGTEYGDEALKQAMTDELRERIVEAEAASRPLRVYCGFDPRTSDLHIGHMVPIRKMRQFQEFGHQVIFLIGRYTSLIGDPSDQDVVRARLTLEEATANAESYADQAMQILDPEMTIVEYNDRWLSELTFKDLIEVASYFTVQQFLSRETFRNRFNAEDPIFLHEFFYALMQAYDAYALEADVQIGGSDQLFNIISAGRKLMEVMGAKPNIGIILGILPGTDGVIRMSKSLGNHIPLNTSPQDMYGKVMSVPDLAMKEYFRLATRWTPRDIAELEEGLQRGTLHPRDAKMRLAFEVVDIYYGRDQADVAQAEFRQVFQEGGTPETIPEYTPRSGQTLLELLVDSNLVKSKSEARRLIQQKGVKLDDQVLEDPQQIFELKQSAVLRVGKRRFLRLLP